MVDELDEEGNPTGSKLEYHPDEDEIEISFSFKKAQLSEQMGAESSDSVNVFHLPLAEEVIENVASTKDATDITADDISVAGIETKIEDLGIEVGDDETAVFTTDGLSVFAFTVDFHYEVNGQSFEFSIPGGGFISLSDLVQALEIAEDPAEFLSNVEKVEFSSPELVDVSRVEEDTTVGQIKDSRGLECEYSAELTEEQIAEINAQTVKAGDWALISLQPFTSEETLTITMKNGDTFTIRVTDAQIHTYVISDSGEKYEVIVTYDDSAEIPDGAELKVREILPEDEDYAKIRGNIEAGLAAEDQNEEATDDILAIQPVKPVLFDIAIWDGEREIEPAEGSEVKVEVKLAGDALKGLFSDEDTPLLINDAPVQEDNGCVEKKLQVIHHTADGETEVMDTFDNITAEEFTTTFTTDSFSSWLVFLDESATEITVGPGDSIVLRPYDEWSWDNPSNQSDYWINPGNDSTVRAAANVTPRTVTDSNLGHTYTFYDIVVKSDAAGKEFDVKTEGGRTIHVKVGTQHETPDTVSTVNNADEGITFNLYDYDEGQTLDESSNKAAYWTGWNTNTVSQNDSSNTGDYTYADNKRIYHNNQDFNYKTALNNGHYLKFLGWGYSGKLSNHWSKGILDYTGTTVSPEIVKPDLVEKTISGGAKIKVPALNNFSEDLLYLFNPTSTFSSTDGAVQAYKDANGLFQKGSNGYYYYNSNQNYAWYNPDTNRFEVYEHTYQQHTGKNEAGNGKPIGFFPFHPYEPDTDTNGAHSTDANPNYGVSMNHNKYLNHHFGMDMAVEFSVPADGLDEFGNPITFEFSGDDDLWVFIDGKLVLDVGGLHQPVTASINFSNDVVMVNGQPDTTIQEMFNKSTSSDKTWKKGDDEPHTLQVFYLERGGCDSNLSIRFNLPTKLGKAKVDVVKRDSDTSTITPLQGVQFELFDNGRCEGNPIRKGTSNANGEVSLGELAIADANTTYYLKEKKTISGYVLDTNVYRIKPKLESGKIVRDSSNYIVMEVIDEEGHPLNPLENGAIVFPNDKIEKINVPAEKTWTHDVVTEDAQVTLTIKRYKLVDLTNGLYIVQDLNGKPDNYQFQADYTVTYPDGHQISVDYSAFESGIYKVPDTVPGEYTIVQNIRSGAPDRSNMTNDPCNFTRTVNLAEYPGAGARAEFDTTFTAKTGTLHLTASVTGSATKPDFKNVRYAIIDANGRKVGTATYAELSGNSGKNLTLPIGTYSVRALNVPDDPNGSLGTHTVKLNNVASDGSTLGNIVVTEGQTTNVAFNSNYSSAVSNCYFKVVHKYDSSKTFMQEKISNINGKGLKSGDKVTVTLYINKDKMYLNNQNDIPQVSNASYVYLQSESDNSAYYVYDVTFTVDNNKTIEFKVNEHDSNKDLIKGWNIRRAASASANAAPRSLLKAFAVSTGDSISLNNDAELPAAPDFKKYVKDSWTGTTMTLNKTNTPEAWHNVLMNLDATDSDGNKYYYYIENVVETGLEADAETICEIGTDENGKLQMISIDNYKDEDVSLTVNNTVKRQGALMLTKIITLNDADSTTSLTDGDYKFSIEGMAGTATADERHSVTIHFANGRAAWYKVDNEDQVNVVGLDNRWSVVLNDLTAGDYTITETEQPQNMTLKSVSGGNNDGNVAQKKITATVVAGDDTPEAQGARVEFTNNREETVKISVSKSWEPEPDPSDKPSVTFELRRYAKKTNGTINITLKDDNGAAIAGAEFELYCDDEPTGKIFTTDVNGQTSATGLEGPHKYKLVQKTTPRTYSMQGDGVKTESAELTVSDTSTAVQEVTTDDPMNKLLVTAATIELTLTDSGAGSGTQGAAIKDGTFVLYKNGELTDGVYTTGNDGKIKITVGPGQYQFIQTGTPDNYRMPGDPAVTPVVDVVDEPWREQEYTCSKTNDLKGKGTMVINLKKDGTLPIEGARFQLKNGEALIAEGATGSDGIVRFENVYEGVYTVHQVDVGNAGGDYTPADDQNNVEIRANSETNQEVQVSFVNNTTAGNVTFKLWKKQSKDSNPTNWELIETIPGKKVNQTYDFVATIDAGMYPNNVWFYWDTVEDFTSGQGYNHDLDSQNVSSLDPNGFNNGTYRFSFKPTEDNTTYNLVMVSGWGFSNIYSFSMEESAAAPSNSVPAMMPNTASRSVPRMLSISKVPARVNAADVDAWENAPADYVVDSEFTDKHIQVTLTNSPWSYTFPAQDKYDKNGDSYYYYVVETAHAPEEYVFSDREGDPTDSDKTFNFINRRPRHGGLEITKYVMYYDAVADTDAKKALLNGDYTFTVKKDGTPIAGSPFTITVTNGISNSLIIPDLEEGDYTVEETGFNGLTLKSATGGSSVENNIVTAHVTAGKNTQAELLHDASAAFTNSLVPASLKIIKVKKGDTETKLPNAEFQLTRKNSSGTYDSFENDAFEEIEINKTTHEKAKKGPFTVGSPGEIIINDLIYGDYKLKETKAPDGYIITDDEIAFTINVDGTVTVTGRTEDEDGHITYSDVNNMVTFKQKTSNTAVQVTIENEPGAALPNTGGPGTRVFYLLGSILTLFAGMLLWRRRWNYVRCNGSCL